jgi:hypothetical protein
MAQNTGTPTISNQALILGIVVLMVIALIAAFVFLSYPQNGYFWGFLLTGIVAFVFDIVLYLSSALFRGGLLRLYSMGLFWFGVVMFLGADLATPDTAWGGSSSGDSLGPGLARIPFLIIIVIIIGIGLGISFWHSGSKKIEEKRADERAEWRRSTGVVTPGETKQPPSNQR